MNNNRSFWRALGYFFIAALVGYGLGLGVDRMVRGSVNLTASFAGWLALMLGVTAFFHGLIGYQTITRAFAWHGCRRTPASPI